MTEERKVVESKLTREEAYKKCFKQASHLGLNINLNIKATIPGERLEIEKTKRSAAWWASVIVGFCFYVVPGVLVLVFWKPVEYFNLIFDDNGEGTTVTAQVKGESGVQFFNDVAVLI